MFDGFAQCRIDVPGGASINVRTSGKGPPLLLLHGYPQTHVLWHRIADRLARRFTLIVTGLRGYGDSIGPEPKPDASNYRFRDMADDQVEVMRRLGYGSFFTAVEPGWLFDPLVPAGAPGQDVFTPAALSEYRRCLTPSMPRASCADYRAFATIDVAMEQADLDAGRKVICPVLALWCEHTYGKDDVLSIWRTYAEDVQGFCVTGSSHYLPEERPDIVGDALITFFER